MLRSGTGFLRISLGGDEYGEESENYGAEDHGEEWQMIDANQTVSGVDAGGGCMEREEFSSKITEVWSGALIDNPDASH